MKTKCPKCEKPFNVRNRRCTNEECVLHYRRPKEKVALKTRLWRIWYWRPYDGYIFIKNRFFTRYDLIRTGMKKSGYSDPRERILHGVMAMVEAYLIDEHCPGHYFCSESSTIPEILELEKKQNKDKQKVIDLYVDWKFTYPYMLEKHDKMLYCEDDVPLHSVFDEDDVNSEAYFAYEEEIFNFEQNMLRRAINLRATLWT